MNKNDTSYDLHVAGFSSNEIKEGTLSISIAADKKGQFTLKNGMLYFFIITYPVNK